MNKKTEPHSWRLVDVWGDTADTGHLAWSIVIGGTLSLSAYFLANLLIQNFEVAKELKRAYAMLSGLGGCLFSGVICAFIFPPKREVVEGETVHSTWRNVVLADLESQTGSLGAIADLPPEVKKEMEELQIYDLFANYKSSAKVDVAGVRMGEKS